MKTNIRFIKYKNIAFIVSAIILLIGGWFVFGPRNLNVGPLTPKGFNLGIDFQGGLIHQVKIYSGIDIKKVREFATQAGLGNEVQEVIISKNKKIANESSFLIKTIISQEDQAKISADPDMTPSKFLESKTNQFYQLLIKETGKSEVTLTGTELEKAVEAFGEYITGEQKHLREDNKRVITNVVKESESVIAPVSAQGLRWQAFLLIVFILFVMLVYISIRFKPEYALGAITALFHDTLVILGVIAFAQVEVDLTVIAAILTIIGYSINDTIVVFDRIRENTGIMKDSHPMKIFNVSINQTLSRTIITSITTLLVVIALYFLGGQRINGFAFTMLIGIVVGTYSSIFIAAPVVFLWIQNLSKDKKRYKKMELKEEVKIQEDTSETAKTSQEEQELAENITISKKKMKKLTGSKRKK